MCEAEETGKVRRRETLTAETWTEMRQFPNIDPRSTGHDHKQTCLNHTQCYLDAAVKQTAGTMWSQ